MPPVLKKSLGVSTKTTVHLNYLLELPLREHLVLSLTFTLGGISHRSITIKSGLPEQLEPMDDVIWLIEDLT